MKGKNKKNKLQGDAEYALVYSTDPVEEKRCPGCSRPLSRCVCAPKLQATIGSLRPAVRIERKGRGGKSVTVVFKLPAHETLLKELLAYLKRSLGCGGTYYSDSGEGVIELQGERQGEVLKLIANYK